MNVKYQAGFHNFLLIPKPFVNNNGQKKETTHIYNFITEDTQTKDKHVKVGSTLLVIEKCKLKSQ